MTYATDRIVLIVDAPKANGAYLVEAANDEPTKARLDDDAQDAAEELRRSKPEWTANDVVEALERKGWKVSWLDLVEVAL